MAERGLSADQSLVHRWVVRFAPQLLERFNLPTDLEDELGLEIRLSARCSGRAENAYAQRSVAKRRLVICSFVDDELRS